MDSSNYDKIYTYVIAVIAFVVVISVGYYSYKNKTSFGLFDIKEDSSSQVNQEELDRMNAELDKVRESYANVEKSKPTLEEQTKSMDTLRKSSTQQQKSASTTLDQQVKELDAIQSLKVSN